MARKGWRATAAAPAEQQLLTKRKI